jgi:hypothetical protein
MAWPDIPIPAEGAPWLPFSHVTPDLRASDAEREATAERLRIAAQEGRLDPDELEARLSAAYAARWSSELERLTRDVTPPRQRPSFVQPARTNGLAIASPILGLFWFGWLGSILAIVLGHIALSQIDRSQGAQSGRGFAVAGLALGYFGMLTLAVVALFALGGWR